MSESRHVMFAECFRAIPDDELMAEYTRLLPLPHSNWRAAVLIEVDERQLALPPSEPTR